MIHYIPKDTLAAEIKSRISDIEVSQKAGLIKKRDADKKILLFKSVLSLIDTLEVIEIGVDLGDPKGDKSAIHIIDTKNLEVKEVDLEKYYHDFLQKEWFGKNCNRTISEMMAFTAKHFFELGLKAQKGEVV